jgi:chitinase
MMKKRYTRMAVLAMLWTFAACIPAGLFAQQGKVIIGYVGGFRGLVNTSIIQPQKLTHINYAFVDVKNNRAWLHNEKTDTVNFRTLNLLKQQNPTLKILISIGGWTWSAKFSDAVLTDTSRQRFVASAVDIINKYDLDGIDIDWEYPSISGLEGNIFRPEDKQNFVLLFKELRRQTDSLAAITHKKYLLSTAAGGFKSFVDHNDIGAAAQFMDFVNLMTYDYSESGKIASHHTALYSSKGDQTHNNADEAVRLFEAAGVPAEKLVMGVAFYGHSSILTPGSKGLGDSIVRGIRSGGYSKLKDSILQLPGFEVRRDHYAKADYAFNTETLQFITYDDEWSVRQKCKYVKKNKLAGAMFWEYASDPKGYLLDAINKVLK